MSSAEGWKQYKLKNLERLRALTFAFSGYTPPSTEWDHDHCEGCWATFALFDEAEILHSGYFTTVPVGDESPKEFELIRQARESGREIWAKLDAKKWVCPECFQLFRITLGWQVNSNRQM